MQAGLDVNQRAPKINPDAQETHRSGPLTCVFVEQGIQMERTTRFELATLTLAR